MAEGTCQVCLQRVKLTAAMVGPRPPGYRTPTRHPKTEPVLTNHGTPLCYGSGHLPLIKSRLGLAREIEHREKQLRELKERHDRWLPRELPGTRHPENWRLYLVEQEDSARLWRLRHDDDWFINQRLTPTNDRVEVADLLADQTFKSDVFIEYLWRSEFITSVSAIHFREESDWTLVRYLLPEYETKTGWR